MARQAAASRDAAFAHLAAGKRREGAWFKTASELKRRMERDYTELNISLKTLDTLYSGMPESVKRAGPLLGERTVVSAGEFQAAAAADAGRAQARRPRARARPPAAAQLIWVPAFAGTTTLSVAPAKAGAMDSRLRGNDYARCLDGAVEKAVAAVHRDLGRGRRR